MIEDPWLVQVSRVFLGENPGGKPLAKVTELIWCFLLIPPKFKFRAQ